MQLVDSLKGLIEDLCRTYPIGSGVPTVEELCAEEVSELTQNDPELLDMLIQAIGDRDQKLLEQLKKESEGVTHHNTANISGTNHGMALGQNYGSMSNFSFGEK